MGRGRNAARNRGKGHAGHKSKGPASGRGKGRNKSKGRSRSKESEKNEGKSVENTKEGKKPSIQQHEDAALKLGMQYFAEKLLPYLGIEGEVAGLAPTECIHLDLRTFLEDMNVVMRDGSWKHFEFQSSNEGKRGLRRYRVYEALAEYQHKVPVTTYVLFSGNIRRPMTELKEGENSYRIIPIIMKDRNADQVIEALRGKAGRGETLTQEDLIPLLFLLLMDGKTSLKERVKAAFAIIRNAVGISEEDTRRMEAILYLMADKFLERKDMEDVKEGIRMTRLGQMLVDWGRDEGREEGRKEGEDRLNRLYSKLVGEKKYADLKRATEDKGYQEYLFQEYKIV